MVKIFLILPGIIFTLLFAGGSAYSRDASEEKILSFQSDILLDPDGSMTVTESITVCAGSKKIKHGIYRDFPTRYQDHSRNVFNVEFQVQRVLRDGKVEPYHMKDMRNGKRVYIGSQDAFVSPGVHVYALTYKTDRQTGFFKDFDELYWNATGNGWDFVIEKARAVISLPASLKGKVISYEAYSGSTGARQRDYSSSIDESGNIVFTSTKPIFPGQGLTVAVTWPKGYIARPPLKTRVYYFARDNAIVVIGLLGLAIVVAYYLFVWYRFGKDPVKGTIIPLYKPPGNLTPQAMRYIAKMGYDSKVFGCAVIDMAVKGYLSIHDNNSVITLRRAGGDPSALSADELEIGRKLLSSSEIVLQNTRHDTVSASIGALKLHLKRNYEKTYFFTNIKFFIPGAVLSVLILMAGVYIQAGPDLPVAVFMSAWLTGWSVGVFFLMTMVAAAWKGYLQSAGRSSALLGQAVFISIFAVPFIAGELVGLGVLLSSSGIAALPILMLFVFVNMIFYHLLKAPTLAGRRVMDKIEGFKMYLGVAEKDRLNTLYGPERTPELFEQYLPYALAFDVEQAWAEKFAAVLQAARTEGAPYRPAWYSGTAWSSFGVAGFASSVGGSVSQAISSASHAPGSSSGSGGGGSSGGGGGGGGGGGW
ncbi:MAG: DUF2207 domain-containing protein [Candidatus Omnitrophota bacterium]